MREPYAFWVCRPVAEPTRDEEIPFVAEKPKPSVEPGPKCECPEKAHEMDGSRGVGTTSMPKPSPRSQARRPASSQSSWGRGPLSGSVVPRPCRTCQSEPPAHGE